MLPPLIEALEKTLASSMALQLMLCAAAAAVLGGLLRRPLPVLGGALRLVGQLGLLGGLAFYAVQWLHLPLNLNPLDPLPQDQPAQIVSGSETRVPMARDGHFWVQVRANGTVHRLLVDTGATLTTLSDATAGDMGAIPDAQDRQIALTTANGQTQAQLGVIPTLAVGNIIVRHLPIAVAAGLSGAPGMPDTNVLGMNFLSQLASWRVEGRTLILVPHHPQGKAKDKSEG